MKVLQLLPNEPVLLSVQEPVSKKLRIFSFVFELDGKLSSDRNSYLTPRLLEWSQASGKEADAKSEKARQEGCQ